MIDADHWHDCEDGTAWLVTDSNMAFIDYTGADRPCDGCDGRKWCLGNDTPGMASYSACPECDGTGRHTFDIEVAWQTEVDAYDSQTYRVSVEPGMTLPIRDWHWKPSDGTPQRWLSENGVTFEQTNLHRYSLRESDGFHITSHPSNIALPPAASPGKYAVKVRRIIDEGDV